MAGAQSWYRDTETGQYVFDAFVLIYAPVDVCFADWSNFETFPKLLSHITGVKRIDRESLALGSANRRTARGLGGDGLGISAK